VVPRRSVPILLILLVTTGALGCATVAELFRDPEDAVVPQITPDPLYEELVSHYVELCALSQYRPLDGSLGGIPGPSSPTSTPSRTSPGSMATASAGGDSSRTAGSRQSPGRWSRPCRCSR
jgi:hypothetical protein